MRFLRLLAVAALAAAAVCQRPALVVQNLSQARQQAWVFVGAPASQQPGTCKPQGWPAVALPGGLAVQVDLPGGARAEVHSIESGGAASPRAAAPVPAVATFAALSAVVAQQPGPWSPWVFDEPARLVPHFLCWQAGWPYWSAPPAIVSVEMLGPALRVAWRTRIAPPVDLTIEGWWTFWPDQDVVDVSLQAVWATTATTGMSADLGELQMVVGERSTIDHAVRKGLPAAPTWYAEFFGGMWGQVLATPRTWGRASRIQWTGALLCLPAGERWAPAQDARHANLAARLQGPLVGVSGAWAGSWGALGEMPDAPPGVGPRSLSSNAADEYFQRPLANPKEAGTTGEQPDFGCCSRDGDVATLLQPAALFDDLWQVQAWGLRPTSNREPSGAPVTAAAHPNCITYGQRPHVAIHPSDEMGWADPLPYFLPGSGYGNQDDQHRSDNLLVGTFLCTRSPLLGSVIADHLELDQLRIWPPANAPIASPRDWGRTLLAWGGASACGFQGARPLMLRSLGLLHDNASFRHIPQDAQHTVRVLSDGESKYGWKDANGQDIRAVACFQEGIAAIGLEAAYRQTGDARARNLAVTVGETLTRHAFFQDAGGHWLCCYAIRWRTDDPGAPLPPSAYWAPTPQQGDDANKDVFVYGIQRWELGAVQLAQSYSADAGVRDRAATIIAAYPIVDWSDAAWRAIR